MPPLEALRTQERLRMDQGHVKQDEWQKTVSGALAPPMENRFHRLEVTKQVALDCARAILGTTGGRRMRHISHHSEAVKRLKSRLTLLRVVRREIHSRKKQGQRSIPPSEAMRKAGDASLYPKPADSKRLTELWLPQNQAWAEGWLRMLRRLSAEALEHWQQLRQKELKEVADLGP